MTAVKLCECGCGQPAPIAKQTKRRLGHVAGQPIRFIQGHQQRRASLRTRFEEKYVVDEATGCWLWTAKKSGSGYGQIRTGGREAPTRMAHRVAYELFVGEIPAGLQLDHLCRTPACVNPAHLEPVSPRENTLRGDTLPAANVAKTHCVRGHPLDGPHVRVVQGERVCRECRRLTQLDRRRRERASA